MEAPLLEASSGEIELIGDNGDYVAVKGVKLWWRIFCVESAKLWRIGGPIAFQILCQYGNFSVTIVFVGHLGDIQLSAFSIALSVVCNFSFGFLLGWTDGILVLYCLWASDYMCGGKVEMTSL
ncbi:detoxifying efflux carrier 35 [Perilla frutescens var. hirtella]|nr:detoxifying efflux carrier 35 [Perilla frutescens var. hirtella]